MESKKKKEEGRGEFKKKLWSLKDEGGPKRSINEGGGAMRI